MYKKDIKKMSVTEQIKFVKLAKTLYENGGGYGMCQSFERAYSSMFGVSFFIDGLMMDDAITFMLKRCLPIFNYENLFEKGEQGLIPKLKVIIGGISHSFWWDVNDHESRFKVFDWLIEELEKSCKKIW